MSAHSCDKFEPKSMVRGQPSRPDGAREDDGVCENVTEDPEGPRIGITGRMIE